MSHKILMISRSAESLVRCRMKSANEMNDEILLNILSGHHYNILDRRELGIWPHTAISMGRCISVIKKSLLEKKYFPRKYKSPEVGRNVGDVMAIEAVEEGRYVLHSHSASQNNLAVISEESHKLYETSESVIREYLKWELGLPGDLDGWKVTE
jgi:hypothetical protein